MVFTSASVTNDELVDEDAPQDEIMGNDDSEKSQSVATFTSLTSTFPWIDFFSKLPPIEIPVRSSFFRIDAQEF